MGTARDPEQPKPKFGIRWWVTAIALNAATYYVFSAAYRTGRWVLVAAMWAALLTYVTVSFRSATKQERRRRTPTG
jgi:uncharacterized membrane protein YgcG